MPTLQWARIAFEQGSFDWIRRMAIKNNNFDLVPMLRGPGSYMVADHLALYDLYAAGPEVTKLIQASMSSLDEYVDLWQHVEIHEHNYGSLPCPSRVPLYGAVSYTHLRAHETLSDL
eukprot:11841940-Karenia_brevis.AAC.1